MTAIDWASNPPGLVRRDVVLVVGPWLAGTTSMICALRGRMPEHTFVESGELNPGHAPVAVVITLSASAVLTESDCTLIDLAIQNTDLVIGVVSKVDTHRTWREVLAADRVLLAQRASNYAQVPWVGAAAAPDLGEPRVDELVGLLRQRLSNPDVESRNRLRAWESRLQSTIGRHRADGSDRRARVRALHQTRDDLLDRGRRTRSERDIALRSQLKQARVQLAHAARNRATTMRGELADYCAQLSRSGIGTFESHARTRVREAVDELEEATTDQLVHLATGLHLPPPPGPASPSTPDLPAPPLTPRRQETQLMTILGAGFGLGVALVVMRLVAAIAPDMTVAGLVAGGLVGLVVTVWVVGTRGLLQDRAMLDRWAGDVVNVLRSALEERVATRVLAAETALCAELSRRDALDSAQVAQQVAEIDSELRAHAVRAARAADHRMAPLLEALAAVRTELYGTQRPKGRSAESIHP